MRQRTLAVLTNYLEWRGGREVGQPILDRCGAVFGTLDEQPLLAVRHGRVSSRGGPHRP
jgi:hypothetical protein